MSPASFRVPRNDLSLSSSELRGLLLAGAGDPAAFEKNFCATYGYRDGVWFPYGRIAMAAFLECTRNSGNGIAVSVFHCPAVKTALRLANCVPSYVDTEPHGFNQDPEQFAQAMKRNDVRAGIWTSLWGIPPRLEVPHSSRKPILYDFAQRSLDSYRPPLQPSDAVLYSLGAGKPLSSLRGAMLCSDNQELVTAWRGWRDARAIRGAWPSDFLLGTKLTFAFLPLVLDLLYHLPFGRGATTDRLPSDWNRIPSQGIFRLGETRLGQLAALREERARQIESYFQALTNRQELGVTLPPKVPHLSHLPLIVENREALSRYLDSRRITTASNQFDRLLSDDVKKFPNAEKLTRTVLHLPLFFGLTAKQIARIGATVTELNPHRLPSREAA